LVLSRGIIGDTAGIPKVACPIHKKAFSLESGKCLSGEDYAVDVYNVKVVDDDVYLQFPAIKAAENSMDQTSCDCRISGDGSSPAAVSTPERYEVPCLVQ
jgi:hypothetical protein